MKGDASSEERIRLRANRLLAKKTSLIGVRSKKKLFIRLKCELESRYIGCRISRSCIAKAVELQCVNFISSVEKVIEIN